MNNRTCLLILIFLISFAIFSKQAYATGIGPFIYFGGSNVEMQGMKKTGTMGLGAGLLVDTSVARDKLFNYRLNLSYTYDFYNASLHLAKMNHAFGLGVYRTNRMRIWFGPQLGLGYIYGEVKNDTVRTYSLANLYIGFVCGVNIHLNQVISLAIDAGYNFGTFTSTQVVSEKTDATSKRVNFEFKPNFPYHEGYLAFGVIFRIRETFKVTSIQI